MAELLGQIAGIALFILIIYYLFISPIAKIDKGLLEIQKVVDGKEIKTLKVKTSILSLWHIVIPGYMTIQSFLKIANIDEDILNNEPKVTDMTFSVLLLTITVALIYTFAYSARNTKDNNLILKLSFIVKLHSLIGFLVCIAIGATFYTNPERNFIGIILLAIAIVEIYYYISCMRLHKKFGIEWKSNKS